MTLPYRSALAICAGGLWNDPGIRVVDLATGVMRLDGSGITPLIPDEDTGLRRARFGAVWRPVTPP